MLLVAVAIALSTAAGVWADRRHGERAQQATRRLMDVMLWGLLPPITFFVVARLELTSGVGLGLVFAYAELAIVGTVAWLVATRLLRLGRASAGTLVLGVVLANTGYLGIPLCAALLGRDAVGPAIAYDLLVSGVMVYTAGFAVGAATGTTAGDDARERMRSFLTRNPVLATLALALVAPDALAPDALVDAAEIAAFALLPLGFFILGVHLTEEGSLPGLSAPIAWVLALRLAVAPALLLAFATLLVDVPDAYLVQAAMPTGINSLIVVHVYGMDLRLAAGAIAWTTATVVVVAVGVGLA